MSEVKILVQPTPNPDALKFIVNAEVISHGKATFGHPEECFENRLALDLLSISGVIQIHFFENVVTVTIQDRSWDDVEKEVRSVLLTRVPAHNPDFMGQREDAEKKRRSGLSEELQKVESILDDTVRAGLQADGGDIQVLELTENKLYVRYEGACGTCPSATTGTLYAIESILRDQFDSEIEVIPV